MIPIRLVLKLAAFLLVLGAAWIVWRNFQPQTTETVRVADPPAMLREIRQLSELTTIKYSIQKVIGLEEQRRPLGSERILLIVQARVLGGIDLGKMTAQDVSVTGLEEGFPREVTIRLPKAEILHVIVDEKETKVWDRKITWWTPWVPYDRDFERRARLAALDSLKESAIKMGILKDSQRNAELAIRNLMEAAGVQKIRFTQGS